MYRIKWQKEWLALVVLGLAFAIGTLVYPFMPALVPLHWNIRGEIDGFMPKSMGTVLMMPLIALVIYVMLLVLPCVDPQQNRYVEFDSAYRVIRNSVLFFFVFIALCIYSFALWKWLPVGRIIPAGVGVVVISLGNVMGKIRQNFFIGFKLPWTLASEVVWNKTNRVGGKLFVVSGIAAILGAFFPAMWSFIILISSVLISTLITVLYSYTQFKKEKKPVHHA